MSVPNDQLFALPVDQLNVLRDAGDERSFAPGKKIFREGEPSNFAVIIEQGMVKVTVVAENGFTSLLAFRKEGELIGELGCIVGAPRSATVIARTRVTATLIPAARFRQVLEDHPRIQSTLLAITINRLRESDRLCLELGAYQPFPRVARALLGLVERLGDGERSVILHVQQSELAGVAGVSRSTVDRVLADLDTSGAITRSTGRITIRDIDLLRAIVAGRV